MKMMNPAVSDNFDTRIEDELKRVLHITFARNERIVKDLETVKTVAEWFKKTKENKKKIPSIITNEAIKQILNSVAPYLSRFLVESIKVETDVHAQDTRIKQVQFSFGLKPYVEYVMKVNSVESKKARITFHVTISGKLENIQFPSYDGRRYITIEKLSAVLTLSIIKIAVYIPSAPTILPLNKPIVLCDNQVFKIEKLSYQL
jgi:hypothetical protein